MAVTVHEKWASRELSRGENPAQDLLYIVRGTDDDLEAKAALAAAAPLVYDGLHRQTYRLERTGQTEWEGSVHYGRKEPAETGDSSYQFDTGGGTQHITHSRQTAARYAPSGQVAPDFQGAIGATHDSVEGVDVTVPVYNFSETHYIPSASVTDAYKGALFLLTGRTNLAAFRGFAPGEVLFLGASGSKRGEEDWEITYRFAASPNATDLTVGPITGIAKRGWDYLWVRYQDAEDTQAKSLVKRPIGVYIERVYDEGDFSGLGIGN